MKILAALSGGVDSTVAAYLGTHLGDVTGIYLSLWGGEANSKSCSTADESAAVAAAKELGIELITDNLNDRFDSEIVTPYRKASLKGETLSPCVDCNSLFKLEYLSDFALQNHFDAIITGHYARITKDFYLGRGEPGYDQSYFLHKMTPGQLHMFRFPLGRYTKDRVRTYAKNVGLSVADKPASTDLCFNPKGLCGDSSPIRVVGCGVGPDTTVKPGELTVGQRKGLPLADTSQGPYYVTDISEDQVTIGRKEDLYNRVQHITDVRWVRDAPANNLVMVQQSSQGPVNTGRVGLDRIFYAEPRRLNAPGQDLVFYDESNTKVIGSAIATKTN